VNNRSDGKAKKKKQLPDGEEEGEVSSYWMTLRKRADTVN